MITLEDIKEYFGEECQTFPKLKEVDNELSTKTKKILYEIGLPNYKGYGGEYIMLNELQLVDNKYLQFAKESFFENHLRYIDLETGNVFNMNSYPDDTVEKYVINSDLESYLNYVYVYMKYMEEIEIPEKLGNYHKKHSKYAKELKKRLLIINQDVNKGLWADLIEEMDLGVI